jgi:hypothetical protein
MAVTKAYKYGYQPDPRKFAPISRFSQKELFPSVVRPPCALAPTAGDFLERCDVHEGYPTADFKGNFDSWESLMTSSRARNIKVLGMPRNTAIYISECIDEYRNGKPPMYFDAKAERAYWKQFKRKDGAHVRVPELPEKYRPHQLGVEQRPGVDHESVNRMPSWAEKEEERLAQQQK